MGNNIEAGTIELAVKLKARQLYSNVMFALQDGGVLGENEADILPNLEEVTEYLRRAMVVSHPKTRLYFIEDDPTLSTYNHKDISISEIASGTNGLPLFTSTIDTELYRGDVHMLAVFSWKMKDGSEHSAAYPHLAFYISEE
jgi:hypothetical protein